MADQEEVDAEIHHLQNKRRKRYHLDEAGGDHECLTPREHKCLEDPLADANHCGEQHHKLVRGWVCYVGWAPMLFRTIMHVSGSVMVWMLHRARGAALLKQ